MKAFLKWIALLIPSLIAACTADCCWYMPYDGTTVGVRGKVADATSSEEIKDIRVTLLSNVPHTNSEGVPVSNTLVIIDCDTNELTNGFRLIADDYPANQTNFYTLTIIAEDFDGESNGGTYLPYSNEITISEFTNMDIKLTRTNG